MKINQKQIEFLYSLPYLTGYEVKDLLAGYTDIEVLLDCEDLETFEEIGKQ